MPSPVKGTPGAYICQNCGSDKMVPQPRNESQNQRSASVKRSRNDSGPHELPASKERRTAIVRPILRQPEAENLDDNPTSDDDAVSNMSDLELDILAEESDESDDEGMLGQLVRKRLRDIDVLNDPHNTFLVSCQPMTTNDIWLPDYHLT
ncbi:hypothetical protein GCM10023116_25410 [Kistimonas scapharcae]|uniref:Uncharacterized protein n=1 Tax=Kistimonas scapharcae TaxID=1036133 RepID=A0ABP8V476_9GAMM